MREDLLLDLSTRINSPQLQGALQYNKTFHNISGVGRTPALWTGFSYMKYNGSAYFQWPHFYLYYDLSLLILVLFYFFPPEFLPLCNFFKLRFYLICHFSFCSVLIHRCNLLCSNETSSFHFVLLSSCLVYSGKSYLLLFYCFTFQCIVSLHLRFPLMCVARFKVMFIDIKTSEASHLFVFSSSCFSCDIALNRHDIKNAEWGEELQRRWV